MRRKWLWISGTLVVVMGALLYYVLDRDIWPGRCWMPRAFGFETLSMRFGDELRDYCLHVPLEYGVVNVRVGPNNGIVAYATVPSELIPHDRNIVDYGPVT